MFTFTIQVLQFFAQDSLKTVWIPNFKNLLRWPRVFLGLQNDSENLKRNLRRLMSCYCTRWSMIIIESLYQVWTFTFDIPHTTMLSRKLPTEPKAIIENWQWLRDGFNWFSKNKFQSDNEWSGCIPPSTLHLLNLFLDKA